MEESRNISASLSAKSDQINDIIDSLPEENSEKKGDYLEDENKLIVEDVSEEQKAARTESLQKENTSNMENPVASEETVEVQETSNHEMNGVGTDEQSTTESPSINTPESGKPENLHSSTNIDEDDIASNTLARVQDQALNSQEANSELTNSQSDSCVNSKHSSESPGVEGGSHRSPDRKSKVEYRKIKSEVTGEGETSESEGEENNKDTTEKDLKTTDNDNGAAKDTWMDILGNGLLRKRVITVVYHEVLVISHP